MSDVTKLEAHFYVGGESSPLVVRALRGREAISELFQFEIDLHDMNASFDFDSIVGETAHVVVSWGTTERHFDGIVTHFEQLETSDEGAFYRATLAPRAILADLGTTYRVFSSITLPELIHSVLGEHGLTDVRLSLADSYSQRDVVQYGESDWALLSRWMEAEGIRYFFEHGANGHTLVITDAATTHENIDGETILSYRKEALDAGENVIGFEMAQRLVPAKVKVRDYALDDPRSAPEEEAHVESAGGISRLDFPARNAQKRLAALRLGHKKGRGKASTIRFVPGRMFQLDGHARTSYNDTWLLTGVEHEGTFVDGGKAAYRVSFETVPGKTSYRPERKTPWPRIFGAQMGTVTGPTGAEIHTDDKGRALVTFSWDSAGTEVWIPLSQVAASQGFGAVNLPRVGDAVLVEFLDGDPDRPVITGRMYNKVNVHPYTLPGNRTKTVFRDASSPGGEGYNELTFESAKGSEEIFLRAERNARTEVMNDATRHVRNDDALTVDGDRTLAVGGAITTTVGSDDSLTVTGARVVAVGANQTIDVTGDRLLEVAGDLDDVVEGDRSASVSGSDSLTVSGNATSTIEGNRIAQVTGYEVVSVSGSMVESISGDRQTIVEGQTFESHGSLTVCVTGETSYSYGGDMTLESSTIQKIGAPKIYIAAGTNLYLRALESITLEVGSSKLTVKDGQITVTNGGSEKVLSGDTIYLNC
ncbi:MAG: type VI secretion system tip protein VgrG [Polyangiaceae bacterium]|nr:type VI secretion system tip protein VgrG [Polyangiaceae bacterium]